MGEKKLVRKVISKVSVKGSNDKVDEAEAADQKGVRTKRGCLFCQNEQSSSPNKSAPSYTDLNTLRRFLTDRAKILPRGRSGLCATHQRAVSKNIKYARHLALLPFVPKV